jgi:hypothetical protein
VVTSRLHRLHRGVYAVGRRPITPIELAAAAVLAGGPRAALSHGSALALWELDKHWPARPEITLAAGDRRPKSIVVHRSPVPRAELTVQRGIRTTTPARALLDCAPALTDRRLARALNDARHARILSADDLAATLRRNHNHPGRKPLERALSGGPTRSDWERDFPAFCRRYGLPRPQLNAVVCGYEVDAFFAVEGVIVELDSWEFHQDRWAFETDRERDAVHLQAGYPTVRITYERLRASPQAEADRLEEILSARRAPTGTRGVPAPPRRARRRPVRYRNRPDP